MWPRVEALLQLLLLLLLLPQVLLLPSGPSGYDGVMKISLKTIVQSPEFKQLLQERGWKTFPNIKKILTDKAVSDQRAKTVATVFLQKLRKIKKEFAVFEKKEEDWLMNTEMDIPDGEVETEEVFNDTNQNDIEEEKQTVESKKKTRKSRKFSDMKPRQRRAILSDEMTELAGDQLKEKGLHDRLQKKFDDGQLDLRMPCLNLMNDVRLSVRDYKKVRLWIKDILQRGGNLNNMPSDEVLRDFKKDLVPEGLVATEKEARVKLQDSLDHTANRFFMRPDFEDYLEDGAAFEMLTKAGSDGQTGLGAVSR